MLPAAAEPNKPSRPAPSCRTGNTSKALGGRCHTNQRLLSACYFSKIPPPPEPHTCGWLYHISRAAHLRTGGRSPCLGALAQCCWWHWGQSHGFRQGSPWVGVQTHSKQNQQPNEWAARAPDGARELCSLCRAALNARGTPSLYPAVVLVPLWGDRLCHRRMLHGAAHAPHDGFLPHVTGCSLADAYRSRKSRRLPDLLSVITHTVPPPAPHSGEQQAVLPVQPGERPPPTTQSGPR